VELRLHLLTASDARPLRGHRSASWLSGSRCCRVAEDGATFTNYTGLQANIVGFVNPTLFMTGTGTLTVLFDQPVTMLGFTNVLSFGLTTLSAEVFADTAGVLSLGDVNLGPVMFATFGETAFTGFGSVTPFLRAEIFFDPLVTAGSFRIDDFLFDDSDATVPEPGTVSLALLGLGLVGERIRRYRRASVL